MNLSKNVMLSSVLATLASICFVAGVTLLTTEGGTMSNEQSKNSRIDDRTFDKH